MAGVTREQLRGKAQTVLGLEAPERLGPTLMHEHLLLDLVRPSLAALPRPEPEITLENVWAINYGRIRHDGRFRLESVDIAVREMERMKASGGGALVELTNGGIGPDPDGLAEIARRAGVPIVMGSGYYVEEYMDRGWFEKKAEDFARDIIEQVMVGAWGTERRAGIIGEIGCQAPWTEVERRVMCGAVIAQQETGASITVHPGRDPDAPMEVVRFIAAAGGNVQRTIIGHVDRTIFDEDRLFRLAETGCVIEYDFFGWETSYYPLANLNLPNDGVRLGWIRKLIDCGFLSQIVIAHDICQKTRLTRFGGHGYGHIFENVVPMMTERGFSRDEIDAILVRNPRRLLAFT